MRFQKITQSYRTRFMLVERISVARVQPRTSKGITHRSCAYMLRRAHWQRFTLCMIIRANDPSAGSPTETLLRLLLPLSDKVH